MKVLITAGPTQEPIDPVRFITNHSSGKMGIAIAEEFASRGAIVTLIKGPTAIHAQNPAIKTINVVTAEEMYQACVQYFNSADVIVFAAAVADYTPKYPSATKIKKQGNELTIELVKTKDIAQELGQKKRPGQLVVGFALETDNELKNAEEKLKKKHLDFVVLNSIAEQGAGFKHDTNKITIIDREGQVLYFELKAKTQVATDIVNHVLSKIENK